MIPGLPLRGRGDFVFLVVGRPVVLLQDEADQNIDRDDDDDHGTDDADNEEDRAGVVIWR